LTAAPHRPLLAYPLDEILKVFENNHVDPPWSYVLVLGLDTIAILAVAWCVREVLEARRAAAQAKRIEQSTLPLFEGARFVAGNVELADGSNVAIRVTIDQQGAEHTSKNNRTHSWIEIERQIEAQPFYVRMADGERVRVEPPIDVMLVDKLDQMEWLATNWRRRRAELTPGERAVIEGRLERGVDPELQGVNSTYRTTASTGWIMKPTKRRGMYVSAENLSRRHELRARAFMKTAIIVAFINIVGMSVHLQYRTRLLLGQNVVANYGGKSYYQTRNSKGHVVNHYSAIASYMERPEHVYSTRIDVDHDDFQRLPEKSGRIWLRYVPGKEWATALGLGSSVNGPLTFTSVFLFGFGIYLVIRTQRHRRWYEGQVVDQGQGPLPLPTNERFAADRVELPSPPKPKRAAAPAVDRISADFTTETERQD
jgi:hypothetical protein